MSCATRSRSSPEYLKTREARRVRNLMDTGIQLGRRFRALKLWMVLRYFGAEGHARARSPSTCGSRACSPWVDTTTASSGSRRALQRRLLPRAAARARRRARGLNERLLEAVNGTGEIFLSHTRLDGVAGAQAGHGQFEDDRGPRGPGVDAAAGTYGCAVTPITPSFTADELHESGIPSAVGIRRAGPGMSRGFAVREDSW